MPVEVFASAFAITAVALYMLTGMFNTGTRRKPLPLKEKLRQHNDALFVMLVGLLIFTMTSTMAQWNAGNDVHLGPTLTPAPGLFALWLSFAGLWLFTLLHGVYTWLRFERSRVIQQPVDSGNHSDGDQPGHEAG